jgi:hypothetical protein
MAARAYCTALSRENPPGEEYVESLGSISFDIQILTYRVIQDSTNIEVNVISIRGSRVPAYPSKVVAHFGRPP